MSLTNIDSVFAIQSYWLSTSCKNTPDLIIGNSNVSNTMAFSEMVISGVGYCGLE